MNSPHSYVKDDLFVSNHDVKYESGRENWAGVFGLLIFPLLLMIGAFTFYRAFTGTETPANLTYENGGFLNLGTQFGVGGAPPTVAPSRQTDLFVYNSNFIKGSSDGFISRTAYENGARVYLSAQTMYEQECTHNGSLKKESQQITINKGVDTYSAQINIPGRTDGYVWSVRFDTTAPMNLCPTGYVAGKITQSLLDGRVFLSRDGGVTQLTDPEANIPIVVSLTP